MTHAYWSREGQDGVVLVWTNGFSGIELHVKPEGDHWEGTGHWFWDFTGPTDIGKVVARKIPCDR